MNLYLDASSIIYAIEGTGDLRNAVRAWIAQAENSVGVVLTSRLSRPECRVLPLRRGQPELVALYDKFFGCRSLSVIDSSAPVIDLATDLRVGSGQSNQERRKVA